MRTLFLSSAFALLAGSAFAQTTTTQRMPDGLVPDETAEWTLVVVTDAYKGSAVSFAPVPMIEAACLQAAKSANAVFEGTLDTGWSGYGTACLNTRTGAFVTPQ